MLVQQGTLHNVAVLLLILRPRSSSISPRQMIL